MTRWPHRPLRCRGEKAQAIKGGSAPNSKSLIVVRSVLFFCFLFSVFVRFHDYFSLLPLCHTVGALCRRDRHTVTVRMATDSSAAAASEPVGYVTGTATVERRSTRRRCPPRWWRTATARTVGTSFTVHCGAFIPPSPRRNVVQTHLNVANPVAFGSHFCRFVCSLSSAGLGGTVVT